VRAGRAGKGFAVVAVGLEQINTAINQMDQATQRNAAMAGESTAASHSLSQETDELAGLIEFQVGQSGGKVMPSALPRKRPSRMSPGSP
jgi:methyl-accepting chemotaxis protein